LCPVICGGPAAPVIVTPGFSRHPDLAGNRRDPPRREPPQAGTEIDR
jgi:hypothetical protein